MDNFLKITNEINSGTVYVNCFHVVEPNTPFGGYKNSGFGKDLGLSSLNDYY